MVRHKLAEKSDKFHSASCLPIRHLASRHMAMVNEDLGMDELSPKIKDFFETQYMPWVEKSKKNSTRANYADVWKSHLEKHFGETRLKGYKTVTASLFLTRLSEKYSSNTMKGIRNLMSGIFTFAGRRGLIEVNPIHFAGSEIAPRPVPATQSYSVRELEDLISALVDHPQAQLLVALCGFLGTRPSEANGIQWSDIDQDFIHLRRGIVHRVIDDLKTAGSVRSLPIIEPIRTLLALQPVPHGIWVFQNRYNENPQYFGDMVRTVIRPAIEKWNASHDASRQLVWKSLYGLRRTAASTLWSLTKSVEASQQLLGHTTPNVTMRHYLKANKQALTDGLKQLEDSLRK
jgi:integrase